MRAVILMLALGGALILQTTVLDFIQIAGVKPDLLLLLVTFYGFLRGFREGSFFGFIAGLLKDLLVGVNIGHNALAAATAGCLAGFFGSKFYKESFLIVIIVTMVTTLAGQGVYYILLTFLGIIIPPWHALVFVMLPTSVYNALMVPIFYGHFYRSSTRGLMCERRY